MSDPQIPVLQLNRANIVNNIITLFSGSAIAQAAIAVMSLILARYLGPEQYGQYTSALTLTSIAAILFTLGLDLWLLHEGGRMPERISQLAGSLLVIRLVLGLIWFGLFYLIAPLIQSSTFPTNLVRWGAFLTWISSLFYSTLAAYKSILKNKISAWQEASLNMVVLLATIILIFLGVREAIGFLQARVLIQGFFLTLALILISRFIGLAPRWEIVQTALHQFLPYAASDLLAMLFMRMDVLLVAFILGGYAVGIYSPAVGLLNALFLIPAAVYIVTVPVVSHLFINHSAQGWKTAGRSLLLLGIIGSGLSLGLILASKLIVIVLGQAYAAIQPLLIIISPIILLHSLTYGVATILVAAKLQAKRSIVQLLAVISDAVLNLLLLPRMGVNGAAISYTISEFILLSGYSWLALRYYREISNENAKASRTNSARQASHPHNILLINAHSSCNAGDSALTSSAIANLRENFPRSDLKFLMNDPDSFTGSEEVIRSFLPWIQQSGTHQRERFFLWLTASIVAIGSKFILGKPHFIPGTKEIQGAIQAILDADIIVSTPGGYLYSYGRGRALMVMLFTCVLAILAGKPLYFLPQSYGPFHSHRERWLVRWVLNRARLVMSRETISIEQLEACGVPAKKCLLLPDMAFAFQGDPPQFGEDWLLSRGFNLEMDRPLLGITAMNWGSQYPGFNLQEQYEIAIAETIESFLNKHHGKILLLPQTWGPTTSEDDRIPATRIANRVNDQSGSILLADSPLKAGQLLSIFGQMDLFIGTRMHSNIFALTQHVPVIAIGYLHKTLGIARSAGIENWVLDISEVNGSCLSQKLDELWEARQSIRSHLANTIPSLIREAQKAGTLIAADYADSLRDKTNG